MNKIKIFSIDRNEEFAKRIKQQYDNFKFNKNKMGKNPFDMSESLEVSYYVPDNNIKVDCEIGNLKITKFADNEITTQFEEPVRGQTVFLICSTNNSDNILTLTLAIDAAKRAQAKEVVAVIPYFGYARQDKKDGIRGAIGAKVIANIIQSSGADRVITIDLHAEQIQGFFDIPVDHISSKNYMIPIIENILKDNTPLVICSPDAGAMKKTNSIFKSVSALGYDVSLAMFSKIREKPNSVARVDLIGDVKDKNVVITDDIIDTGGTLMATVDELYKLGAKNVFAIITHGLLNVSAIDRLTNSKLTKLYISDSIEKYADNYLDYLKENGLSDKLEYFSLDKDIARIIFAIANNKSAFELESFR